MLVAEIAAEKVFQCYRVTDQAANVELCSLEVRKALNLSIALVLTQESTCYVKQYLVGVNLDWFEALNDAK